MEPAGTLWLNAIRATVIPLVVSTVVVGVANAGDGRVLGRIGWRALGVCLGMLAVSALLACVIVPPLLTLLPLDSTMLGALSARGGAPASVVPITAAAWFAGLLPANVIRAAVDGALLPLVLFAILFGLAMRRVPEDQQRSLLLFFRGIESAMLVLVRWMLVLAPVGIFALTLPIAVDAGAALAGVMLWYVVVVAAVSIAIVALCAVVAVSTTRAPAVALMKAFAPAQLIAFTSRSSLASLPTILQAAEQLAFPWTVSSVFMPLAVATLRIAGAAGIVTSVLFLGHLGGVAISAGQLAGLAATSVLLSFSIPGIPGGSVLVLAPLLMTYGIPSAGLGALLALDTIPDMFRTLTNVTGDLAAGTVLARFQEGDAPMDGSFPSPPASPTFSA